MLHMTDLQKWITSISGAVIGQILVLGLFYFMVVNPVAPRLMPKTKPSAPKEVTVMLSQIIEQAKQSLPEAKPEVAGKEPEPPEPEPAPPPPSAVARQFVETEGKTTYENAPDNARFESDRNTKASTEMLPDLSKPQTEGPTQKGEAAIKNMSLSNQNYVAGEIKPPAPPPPSEAAAPEPVKEPMEEPAPEPRKEEAQELEEKPSEADRIPVKLAEKPTQPDADKMGEEEKVASFDKNIATVGHSSSPAPEKAAEKDEEAVAIKKTEEKGDAAAPEEKKSVQALPVAREAPSISQTSARELARQSEELRKALTESMFDPAYLAHRRKNNQNGVISTLGEGSVDAISTATGAYKKAVNDAIGKKWHEYRQNRASYATPGFLRVQFIVTPAGRIKNVKVVTKEAGELMTEFSLRAIMDAKVPPMPANVRSELGEAGLKMDYNIVIY